MKPIRDLVVRALMGVVGAVFGVLSVLALAIAASIPPIFGLLSVLFAPIRAFVDWLRRPAGAP